MAYQRESVGGYVRKCAKLAMKGNDARNMGGPIQIVTGGPWYALRQRYEKDIVNGP